MQPYRHYIYSAVYYTLITPPVSDTQGGSVAEWLACWTQEQKGNSLRQTVHTHRASVHQAAKLVAAVMAACRRVYDSRHLQADCQELGSDPEPSAEYGLPLPFTVIHYC